MVREHLVRFDVVRWLMDLNRHGRKNTGASVEARTEIGKVMNRTIIRAAVAAGVVGGLLATATVSSAAPSNKNTKTNNNAVAATTTTTTAPAATTTTTTAPAATGVSGSMESVAGVTGGRDLWACGWNGAGVDVALIDTGVTPVAGTGTIVNGPDLSFDAQTGGMPYLDGFGHGTHLASIINGHDPGVSVTGGCRLNPDGTLGTSPVPAATGFAGIAPGARVVNMKVGAVDGAVDVTQVIAAIDWVVQHRNTNGFNIRVLALAYGVPSTADASHDALAHAVDIARRNGIVVVASAGNDGTTLTDLAFPAGNPNVIAVGAADTTGSTTPWNWTVPAFADRGSLIRGVDLIAPAVNIQGLRVPGSYLDGIAPTTTGDRYLHGSGTSQSAAIVAGLAAQLVQRYPTASADQIKTMFQRSSTLVKFGFSQWSQGTGVVIADRLVKAAPGTVWGTQLATTGDAPITSDRADSTLTIDGVALTANTDVQRNPWPGAAWAVNATQTSSWTKGLWNGARYNGDTATATGWATSAWPTTWAGTAWTTVNGPAGTWDGLRWNGLRWNGLRWNGLRWNGTTWEGLRWNGLRWNANTWN